MTLEPPLAIIRPSGVWNARSPLHSYFLETSAISRDHALLTISVSRTRYDATHLEEGATSSSSKFMRASDSGPVARKYWNQYRDYWRRLTGSADGQPSIPDLERSLAPVVYAVREWALIRWVGAFEIFVQCWALNMLLAELESGRELSRSKWSLARQLSPVHTRRPPPGVPEILKCFPSVRRGLDALPHIFSNPVTREPIEEPIHPELTAYRSVLFWRAYRNLVVHGGGLVSGWFVDTYSKFFEAFREDYAEEVLRELEPRVRLQLPALIVPSVGTIHARAAIYLNEYLVERSVGTRGKLNPPGVDEPDLLQLDLISPPLLREGDHSLSFKWVSDENWREQYLE